VCLVVGGDERVDEAVDGQRVHEVTFVVHLQRADADFAAVADAVQGSNPGAPPCPTPAGDVT